MSDTTNTPNYKAAQRAFRRVTAYWAPEWVSDPDMFAKMLDSVLDATRQPDPCERLGCRHDLGECEAGIAANQHPTHDMTDDGCLGCGVEMDAPGSGDPCPNARCPICVGLYGVVSCACQHGSDGAPPPRRCTNCGQDYDGHIREMACPGADTRGVTWQPESNEDAA